MLTLKGGLRYGSLAASLGARRWGGGGGGGGGRQKVGMGRGREQGEAIVEEKRMSGKGVVREKVEE